MLTASEATEETRVSFNGCVLWVDITHGPQKLDAGQDVSTIAGGILEKVFAFFDFPQVFGQIGLAKLSSKRSH